MQIETVINAPIKGELIIHKMDQEGGALHGVLFELSAYDGKGRMVSGFPRKVSDINGTIRVTELPVGSINRENGKIEPYKYSLKEILPPEGFAVNPQIYTFTFQNGEGDYSCLLYTSENGAVLYDQDGNPVPDTSKKIDSWVTDDATDYTDTIDLKNYPNAGGMRGRTGFMQELENMYESYGCLLYTSRCV